MVDTEEFRAHLSVKCSASATFRTEIGTSKAGSKETFYLAMALGRGLNRKFQPDMVPKFSDLVYALYIQAAQHIATYDLYQLGQLSMFLGSPAATDYVPVEFWTENLEKALEDNLMNYQKYRDQLDA